MHRRGWGMVVAILFAAVSLALAAEPAKKKRARPPHWDDKAHKDVARVFLPDAREKLVGERPCPADPGASSTPAAGGPAPDTVAAGGAFAWSRLISAETLEDEIKSLQGQVSKTIDRPEPFKGGGYKECRRYFTELAALFGIIAEYDNEVRWKRESAAVRDLIARAGFNCKVGTDASYKEAKTRKEDLEGLVRGAGTISGAGESQVKWDKIAGRSPLMQRIELAQQQGIAPWTSQAGEFTKNAAKLKHESQIVAALAEVISRDGYEYADDETYRGYAAQMREAALELVSAVDAKDYDRASKASGQISKACVDCHGGYRSN